MRNLLTVQDLTVSEILAVFKRTTEFKKKPVQHVLKDKTLAMIFQKPSTRTRVSFDVAMMHLGGHTISLNHDDLQLGRGETIGDTARALSRYVDVIMARVHSHSDIIELADNSGVPVINGLSDLYHPCQALSDIYTMHEQLGMLRGINLTYIGNGRNNVTHSLLLLCSKLGINMSVACPKKHGPDKAILNEARENAKSARTFIEVLSDPKKAVKDSDVVYTDTWFSMGDKISAAKKKEFKPYQLTPSLLNLAKRNALVMHCLPAHRGQEIAASVMDGEQSIVWDQAENRLHIGKGILSLVV